MVRPTIVFGRARTRWLFQRRPSVYLIDLVPPAYGGACIANLIPALFEEGRPAAWLPEPVRGASQVVLLVLDGLGWAQLQDRPEVAPTLVSMAGGPITSVAPTTTATALCSILVGMAPADHGIVGYRMRVEGDQVLNVLRWQTAAGDARQSFPPSSLQPHAAFLGRSVPVVSRSEFRSSGFTTALGIERLHGWKVSSSIAVEVADLVGRGEPFVYAYYDGIDLVAHAQGFGDHYDAELSSVDAMVAAIAAALPPGAVLMVTSDHGQVEVGEHLVVLEPELIADTMLVSGEGRFTWLHAAPGRVDAVADRARHLYDLTGTAAVRTRAEVIGAGWLGGTPSPEVESRLGDVALIARERVAFVPSPDSGSSGLRCRHGSLTADEMLVPLLAVGSR